MSVKPILFNTEMVRGILDGRKTCTRRKIPVDIVYFCDIDHDGELLAYENSYGDFIAPERLCRYQQGDILYVRETWKKALNGYYYYEDWQRNDIADITKWKPSIHMPKEAARIWLKVKDVRVERLQDMDWQDALYEGIDMCLERDMKTGEYIFPDENPLDDFIDLWDSTIKKSDLDRYGWNANPYVWVIDFERCEKP